MKTQNIIKLIIALVACQAAGFIGSLFTTPYIKTWYATIAHPAFAPPNWVFAPVWTFLFLSIGTS